MSPSPTAPLQGFVPLFQLMIQAPEGRGPVGIGERCGYASFLGLRLVNGWWMDGSWMVFGVFSTNAWPPCHLTIKRKHVHIFWDINVTQTADQVLDLNLRCRWDTNCPWSLPIFIDGRFGGCRSTSKPCNPDEHPLSEMNRMEWNWR